MYTFEPTQVVASSQKKENILQRGDFLRSFFVNLQLKMAQTESQPRPSVVYDLCAFGVNNNINNSGST